MCFAPAFARNRHTARRKRTTPDPEACGRSGRQVGSPQLLPPDPEILALGVWPRCRPPDDHCKSLKRWIRKIVGKKNSK